MTVPRPSAAPSRDDPAAPPLVSVIMANYRGADFLADAMGSVLAQTHSNLELLVSDDASDDESCAMVRRIAARDTRVTLIEAATNGGPSRARNAALALAQGEWIAIVDADDLLHPQRIARLLAAAKRHGADLVADDMVPFGPGRTGPPGTMFGHLLASGPVRIDAIDLLGAGKAGSEGSQLGYLKPLIRRTALGDIRYDETLRNSEDFDLYLRLSLAGTRFVLMPDPTYLYRRHGGSISHRSSENVLAPLLAAHNSLPDPADPAILRAMDTRHRALRRTLRYAQLVTALKTRDAARAARLILRHPILFADLAESLRDRRRRQEQDNSPSHLNTHRVVLSASGDDRLSDATLTEDATTIAFSREPDPDGGGVDADPAARLCALCDTKPPAVLAIGAAGLRGLGYLPGYRDLEIMLSPEEADALGDTVPSDATLR
ncbi:MAG: glycosyltransferase [Jannaschia sp.]